MIPPSGQDAVSAVIGAVDDDRIVRNSEIIELLGHLAYHVVMLDHSVGIDPYTGSPPKFLLQMRPDVHPSGAKPNQERLLVVHCFVDELIGGRVELFINGEHAGPVERAGILDFLRSVRVCP